ncbi:Retrotransposon, unclassified-like protein [Sesbania bispinosa]|nr:Retrotransposon, unclassified-like protein [Sesbania bispinosa]
MRPLFDKVAPPGSSAVKTRNEVSLQRESEFIRRNGVYHPTQALKRPKVERATGIKKEYLPNGEAAEVGIGYASKELQDPPNCREEDLKEVDISEDREQKRPLFISSTLGKEEKERGISAEGHKVKAIQQMEPPKDFRGMQQLTGKIGYIRRFIPALNELIRPIRELLKGGRHTIHVMSKSEGIRYMLNNAFITGRISKWALLLGEYNIQIVHPQKLNCQALANMMALCVGKYEEDASEEMKGEALEANFCEERKEWWFLKFDEDRKAKFRQVINKKHANRLEGFHTLTIKAKVVLKIARDYQDLKGILHKRSSEGLLMKCIAEEEGQRKMKDLHQPIYGQGGPSLYRRMQRVGVFWPSMKTQCDKLQGECMECMEGRDFTSVNIVEDDWRQPIKEFLTSGLLPQATREAEKLRKKAERYFLQQGELFNESFNGEVFKCLGKEEQEKDYPVEILVPSAKMTLENEEKRSDAAETIEEQRERRTNELLKHHRRLIYQYEKMVRPRMFCEGEMVLKATTRSDEKNNMSPMGAKLGRPVHCSKSSQ